MNKVLIIGTDFVGKKMAGPAIRDWEYARHLSENFEVVLAIPNESDLQPDRFTLCQHDAGRLKELAARSDVVIVSSYVLEWYPFLKELDVPLVVCLSHSFVLENLQLCAHRDAALQRETHNNTLAILNDQLSAGDFFVCNSERQRDYWLGMLSALNRVNPLTYGEDRSLRRLIDVVPYGLPDRAPRHSQKVLKGVYKTILPEDKVAFWGGGIYNWLDPLTLIRAMPQVIERQAEVKVFFAGIKHPNPYVFEDQMCLEAIQLSKDLGLYDSHVFFNEWVPYQERENYLLEADVGLSLHLEHVETRYAFRTRILDYIWTGLPIIATEGDIAAGLIQRHDLGRVVAYGDVEGVAQALLELLAVPDLRGQYRACFAPLLARYRWKNALAPLSAFCHAPRKAPDRRGKAATSYALPDRPSVGPSTWRMRLEMSWRLLRERGVAALLTEIVSFWRRRFGL
jgi:glycosyltransferase involved in cell wall biosynthesis